jgi:alpha-tubulin suppressor-like RCC1 family protein
MRFNFVLALCTAAFTTGCESGDKGTAGPPDRQPAVMDAVSATEFTSVVAGTVQDSLRVRVLDQHGAGLAGVDVEFIVVSGGGAVAPARVRTLQNGIAATAWTLGKQSGVQTAAAYAAALPPVSFTATATAGPPAVVTLTPAVLSLAVGDSMRLVAAVQDSHGNVLHAAAVQWSSSDPAVAAVDSAGMVSTLQPGSANIAARAQSVTGAAQIVVTQLRGAVSSVHISPDPLLLAAGDTASLIATLRDAGGSVLGGRIVEWTSSNAAAAAVDASGRIRAGEPGTAVITALSEGRSGTALVRVVHASSRLRLAAGQEHSCALNDGGRAFCWGANWGGQLGNGSTVDPQLAPVPVSGSLTFTALAAGSAHTCGLTVDGGIHCWGDNSYGQLGTGTTARSHVPSRVASPAGVAFIELAAGDYHTCALTSAGAAYCWGSQLAGELGIGAAVPDQCAAVGNVLPCSTRPVAVAGAHTWIRITAGHLFTCGIAVDEGALCWGMNSAGNLGTGDLQGRTMPAAVSGGGVLTAISAGAFHACGISLSGEALCWGLAGQGQTGMGGQAPVTCAGDAGPFPCAITPLPVAGGLRFRQIDAGFYHTCAITGDGSMHCWGLNQGGQLAVPVTGPEQCPTAAGLLPCSRTPQEGAVTAASGDVVAGGYHSLRGSPAGTWSWGANWYGQLGTGDTLDRALPFRVVF